MSDNTRFFLKNNLDKIVQKSAYNYCEIWSSEYPPIGLLKEKNISQKKIDQIRNMNDVVLYIHVPFCSNNCDFCTVRPLYSLNSQKEAEDYVDCLCKEIKLLFGKNNKKRLSSVYIGGGTPTILGYKALEGLFIFLRQEFVLDKKTTFCIESTPKLINNNLARILKENEITRVSLGVQTFNKRILRCINRNQKLSEVYNAVNILKKHQIKNINLDFIFGLDPKEGFKSFLHDNYLAIKELKPNSIFLYQMQNYYKHPDTIYNFQAKDISKIKNYIESNLSGISVINALEVTTGLNLKKEESVKDKAKKNKSYGFLRFVKLTPVIACGFGGASFVWLRDGTFFNMIRKEKRIEDYKKNLKNQKIEYKGIALNKEESFRRYLVLNLLRGIDFSFLKDRFDKKVYNKLLSPINNYLEKKNNFLYLKNNYEKDLPIKTKNENVNYFIFTYLFLYSESMKSKLKNWIN